MDVASLAKAPIWAAQLFTSEKSFRTNPLLGSERLNRWGLHEARVRAAHALTERRRARFASAVPEPVRRAFDEQGFVVLHDFLPPAVFEALSREVIGCRAPARERWEGDTLLRKIEVDSHVRREAPALGALLDSPIYRALMRYGEGRRDAPSIQFETLNRKARPEGHDYQTDLHTDTFHPTVKSWFYLTDVTLEMGPLFYVPGSHRLTPARLAWERAKCLHECSLEPERRNASFRVTDEELSAMGFGAPVPLVVPANTLVVADTFGIHARGIATRPAQRVEVWATGRRSPFLPYVLDQVVQRLARSSTLVRWKQRRTAGAFDS